MKNLNLGAKIGTSFGVGLAIITALGIISYRTTTNLIYKLFTTTNCRSAIAGRPGPRQQLRIGGC